MANVVIDIAAEFTGKKAFDKANKSTTSLQKSVHKLGKQLLAVYSTQKLISFAKESAKAFAADQKSVNSLNVALANTGNAFRAAEVKSFIADLERTTGVLDDNLRPAFQAILTSTGDVTKAEKGLSLALDIAAGTGKDLQSVSIALAKGYSGQTTALSRLGAGLSKAVLKTGDMTQITDILSAKFAGQALSAASGYSGQMDKLAVASENAKEIIGKDLLDTLSKISGKDGIGGATTAMEGFATQIGNVIVGIGILVTKLKSIPGAGVMSTLLSAAGQVSGLNVLSKLGANSKKPGNYTAMQSPAQRAQAVKEARLLKEKNALSSIDNANTTRKLTLTGDQLALDELKKKFDITRIELGAALNNTVDRETQLRILSLLAIHDNDAALAGKIQAELEATEATKKLSAAMISSIEWVKIIGDAFKNAGQGAGTGGAAAPSAGGNNMPSPFSPPPYIPLQGTTPGQSGIPGVGGGGITPGFGMGGWTMPSAASSSPTVVVNVAGSVTTQQDLVSAITQGIYNNQASGIPISYSTSYR